MTNPRLRARDRLNLITNLATMLSAGIPILEAVDTLLVESKGSSKEVLTLIRKGLEQGKPISESMKAAPLAFDPVTVNIVRASEEAGTLDQALTDLQATIKKDIDFTDRLKASLIYPVFVIGVFLGVLILILTFVIPRVSKVFDGLRITLPPTTKALIGLSEFVLANYIFIFIAIALIGVGIFMLIRFKRRQVVNVLLSLPFLDNLGRQIDLARFTRTLKLQLKAGLPLSEALELSRGVVSKKEIESAIISMKRAVDNGEPISEGLKHYKKVVPSVMIRILQTAEKSGTLEKTMQDLADYFDEQVTRTLKNVSELIEPVLIVVIGLLIGGMMLSIIAPIYGLISQLGGR
ncbi:MAG TPA: type II secretion system F family protein [Candidatus Saccharimonadales bacterium]|nr:type II secretion system F family protein [Candidatus Saccharimonadales bacterium]